MSLNTPNCGSEFITKHGLNGIMSKERMQQLYEEMGMLESQYKSLLQHEAMLGNAYREAESAAATLRATSAGTALDTLVPVGSGVFFDAHIANSDKVILNIGAGTAIKKDRTYAMNYIESRIKEFDVAISNAAARKNEISTRIQQGRQELERLAHSATGSAPNNV